MFGNQVAPGSVEPRHPPWGHSKSKALSFSRRDDEGSCPECTEWNPGPSSSAGLVFRKHPCGERAQVLLLPLVVAGIWGVGPPGEWCLQREPQASGSRQAPEVLFTRGPAWAFERVIALNSLCLMTRLYEELLNKGRRKQCQVRLQPGFRPREALPRLQSVAEQSNVVRTWHLLIRGPWRPDLLDVALFPDTSPHPKC